MTFAEADRQQFIFDDYLARARFEGPIETAEECARLEGQIKRIYDLIRDGRWRTLAEIEVAAGAPQASVSAQLRHLRKLRWGAHIIDKRRRGERTSGLWEYRMVR